MKSEEAAEAKNAQNENERLKLEVLNEDNRRQSCSMADKLLELQQNLREKDKQLKVCMFISSSSSKISIISYEHQHVS